MQVYIPSERRQISRLLFHFPTERISLRQSLSIIENAIIYYALDPSVGAIAKGAVRHCGTSYLCKVKAIHDALRRVFVYRNDPSDRDLFKAPPLMAMEIIERGYFTGDCDDAVLMAGAVLKAAGFPLRLIAVSRDKRPKAQDVDHVALLVIMPNGEELYFDLTVDFLPEPASRFFADRIVVEGDAF